MDAATIFYTVDALLGSSVFAFGLSRVLPMRFPLLFGIVFVGTETMLNGFGAGFVDVWVGVALIFAVQCVFPFFLFEGSAPVRAVTVLAAFMCESCAMLVFYAVFTLVTGQAVPENEGVYVQFVLAHLSAYAVSSVVSWLVLLLLLRFVSSVARRFAGMEGSRLSWIFAAFAMTHVFLMLALGIFIAAIDTSALSLSVAIAACALCLMADILLFSSMDRAMSAEKDGERARVLDAALDACLVRCDAFVAEAEQTAKMRHDVRNQAHAAMALAERGEFSRARDHISSFGSCYVSK